MDNDNGVTGEGGVMPSGEPHRYHADLPACCQPVPWRAPRPSTAHLVVRGVFGLGDAWEAGLDAWDADVRAAWLDDAADALVASLREHLRETDGDAAGGEMSSLLAAHGLLAVEPHQDGWTGIAGRQTAVVARIASDFAGPTGRPAISTGADLWDAADGIAGDLEELVAGIADLQGSEVVNDAVRDVLGADVYAITDVLLLRAAHIAPVLRGHGLGAWAAAATIAMLANPTTLIATLAAPLDRRDAIPDLANDRPGMTEDQQALWHAEQNRLAAHWATALGLRPLQNTPEVLVHYTGLINPALDATLQAWAP